MLYVEPLRDVVNDAPERDGSRLRPSFHDDPPNIVGEGSGVMSVKAASWGDEKLEAGDREPAVECVAVRAVRVLGTRRGRLVAEALRRR